MNAAILDLTILGLSLESSVQGYKLCNTAQLSVSVT